MNDKANKKADPSQYTENELKNIMDRARGNV